MVDAQPDMPEFEIHDEPSMHDTRAECVSTIGNVDELTVVATLVLGFALHQIVDLYNARWIFHAKGHREEDDALHYMWAFAAAMCFVTIVVSILNKRYMKLKPPHTPLDDVVKLFSAIARNGLFLGTSLSLIATSMHIRSNALLIGSIVLTLVVAVVVQLYKRIFERICSNYTV